MNITLENVGKRFGRNWVFRNISIEFKAGKRYVILGPNGSGKSTLLKLVSGNVSPSEGTVSYSKNGEQVKVDDIYQHVSITAPYLDIPEEYTLEELVNFHRTFKNIEKDLSTKEVIELLELGHTLDKAYKHFSSGMKQRVKLGLAILSTSPLLLLDEPSTALDAKAVQWYQNMIREFCMNKTIIVFSNNKEEEFAFCEERVRLGN
ncbi:MAG TPA: ABC transporter ATP-binding protein [Bacteroidia bacterium]|jgi:ABC-type multidrug transport system ATPase subunit|nr:ABC transporter ATP-binding protein [Bacteroidia bacterium]